MPLISTTAGVVWIDECGSGEPLLLLHGHPGDSGDFDAVLPALSERYRVIRVSWPGFGQGPAPLPPESASAMQYAELLVHLVATLDLAGVRVVGHSVGGYAAAWLALCQPDRIKAVVLVAPGGFASPGYWSRLFLRLLGKDAAVRVLVRWLVWASLRIRTPVVLDMLRRAATVFREPVSVAVSAAVWRSCSDTAYDLRTMAVHIEAPTLVVSGRQDVLGFVDDGAGAAASIPGAYHLVLPCGHAAFAEVPELFLSVVLPFLQSPPPPRGTPASGS